jgi:hypothetical protein
MNLEDELRRSLATQAGRIEPSPESVARLASATRRGVSRRPVALVAAAAAVALVAASAVVIATRSDGTGETVSAGPDASQVGSVEATVTTDRPTTADEGGGACPDSDAGPPPVRAAAALASDGRGLVLFGGTDDGGRNLSDTWRYYCGRWTRLSPTSSPPAAGRPLAAFDAHQRQLRLVAGDGSVWGWEGANWRSLAAAGGLPTLTDPHMVYDSHAEALLVVGANGPVLETWAWRASAWTRLGATAQLGRLRRFGLVHHAALGKTVLFGGVDDGDMLASGTTVWDGKDWIAEAGGGEAPPGAITAGYDERAKAIVAVDDLDGRTWIWDGSWRRADGDGLGRRWDAAVAFDASTAALVVFGGDHVASDPAASPRRTSDVWRWDGRSWALASVPSR